MLHTGPLKASVSFTYLSFILSPQHCVKRYLLPLPSSFILSPYENKPHVRNTSQLYMFSAGSSLTSQLNSLTSDINADCDVDEVCTHGHVFSMCYYYPAVMMGCKEKDHGVDSSSLLEVRWICVPELSHVWIWLCAYGLILPVLSKRGVKRTLVQNNRKISMMYFYFIKWQDRIADHKK